jgi:hybrid cluster-associated redox disulfide protein
VASRTSHSLLQRKDGSGSRRYKYSRGNCTVSKPVLSPELSIAVLLSEYPQAIPVFIGHRMACVGCSMAPFETLRGAAEIYHLPFESFMEEIKSAMEEDGRTTKDG